MRDLSFGWDVELPERGSASLGARRPLSTLVICSESHGQERIPIPKAVGRRLVSLLESDGEQPSGRSELLYRVRAISLELARSKAEDLLNRRDYSSSELAAKLREAGYHPSVADEVVARFVEVGLLDDGRFAELFARSKAAVGWGRIKIERELARRGVDVTQLDGVCPCLPQASFGQERLPEARPLPLRARVSHGCGHGCRKEGPCGGRGGLRRGYRHPPTEHMI